MTEKEIRNNQGFLRLIDTFENYDPTGEDKLILLATWIEDQLQEMGATPGKDYTYLDIAKLAMEHSKVLAMKELAEAIRDSGNSIFSGLDGVANSLDDIVKINR